MRGWLRDRRHLLKDALPPLIGVLFTLWVVLRSLIFTPGSIIYRDLYPGQLYFPHLWHPLGSFLALENYKFVTFTGIFLPLRSLGTDIFEKAVYVGAFSIAYLAFYVAAYRLLRSLSGNSLSSRARHLGSMIGALTFVANPAAANIFFDFSLFVGYAFSPLILLIYLEMLAGQRRRAPAILAVAVLWWLSAIKAHWIVFHALLLAVTLVVWFVWNWRHHRKTNLVPDLASTAAIFVAYLLLSAYWLIPFVRASGERFVGSYAPMTYEAVEYLSYTPLHKAIRLLGLFDAWPYVRFEPPAQPLGLVWTLASWAIPVMAAAALVWWRRSWRVWVLAVFVFGGLLLTKGVAPPLGELYTFLVFGDLTPSAFRWLFRVSSKWNVFLSLGCSGLVAVALAELLNRVRWRAGRPPWTDRRSGTALLAVLGYLVAFPLFAWPSFTGNMNGALVPVLLPDSLLAANQWLAEQEGDFKVNWMPVTNGRELDWNRRPSGDLYTSLSSQPSIATGWNRHPVLYYSYAYDALAEDRIASFGKLLSALNTSYVAFHDDIVSSHIHEGVEPVAVLIEGGEKELPALFEKQRDMRLAWEEGAISIYETERVAPPVYVPQRAWLSTGDLTQLTTLSALEGFQPSENAIIFVTGGTTEGFSLNADGLILGLDAPSHLAFGMLPAQRFLSPAGETHHGSVTEAWSRYDIFQFDWQSVLREHGVYHWGFDYGQAMVAQTSAAQRPAHLSREASPPVLQIPASVDESDRYQLWVRYLRHPRAGELTVSLDGGPAIVLAGRNQVTGFIWQQAGSFDLAAGAHEIVLQNWNGFTAVNALALVSEDDMMELMDRSRELAAEIPNIYLLEIEKDFDVGQAQPSRETAALSAGRAAVLAPGVAITTTLDLLLPGDYQLAVRGSIPAAAAPLTVTLGSIMLVLEAEEAGADLEWLEAGPIRLESGPLAIELQAGGAAVVDALVLTTNTPAVGPDDLFRHQDAPAEISYQRIDPTRYRVLVRAERPFFLALAETYDPLWVASGPGLQASSVPLYGVINGFFLDRTGSYEITVEYQIQQWARFGTLLTTAAVIGIALVALFMRRIIGSGRPDREE